MPLPGAVPSVLRPAVRRLLLPGSASGPFLVARTIYPDATGKLILPDEARTTDLYAADHEDVYRVFESGEPAVVGGRVVRQLLSNSENLASGWTTFASASIGSQQPDGSWEITITASGLSGIYQSFANLSGENLIGSIEVKRGTYTGNIELGNPAGSPNTGAISGIGSSDFARISFAYTGVSGSNGLWIRQPTGQTASGTIYVRFPLFENATGRSDTTTPSEYVSSDVGLAVYATENGNSVASNVVTEAVGSALSPAPYVLTTPGATNSCAYSQDLTGTGWTTTGLVKAQDAADIFGNANSAWTVEDDDATGYETANYALTVGNNSQTNNYRLWIKKTTSASTFPGLRLAYSGGTAIDCGVTVDTDNGTLTNEGGTVTDGAPASKSITDDGDYWKITISLANNSTGNTTMTVYVYPAVNADAGATWDNTDTGSIIMDEAEIFLNTSHAVAHALPPIPTSGSAGLIDPTEVSIEWPTVLVNDFVTIINAVLESDAASCAIYDLDNGSHLKLQSLGSGTLQHYAALDSLAEAGQYTVGNEFNTRALKSSQSGHVFYPNDVKTDEDALIVGGIGVRTTLNLGGSQVLLIRDFQIWSVPASISDNAVLALTA